MVTVMGKCHTERDDLSLLLMYSVNHVEGTFAPALYNLRLCCCYRSKYVYIQISWSAQTTYGTHNSACEVWQSESGITVLYEGKVSFRDVGHLSVNFINSWSKPVRYLHVHWPCGHPLQRPPQVSQVLQYITLAGRFSKSSLACDTSLFLS